MNPEIRWVLEVVANKGHGSDDDPVRRVFYYHDSCTGELLAYRDPWQEEEDALHNQKEERQVRSSEHRDWPYKR